MQLNEVGEVALRNFLPLRAWTYVIAAMVEEHTKTCSLTRTEDGHNRILRFSLLLHQNMSSPARAWKGGGCTSITLHGRTAPSPLETRLLLVRNKPQMLVLCGGEGIRRREQQKERERETPEGISGQGFQRFI